MTTTVLLEIVLILLLIVFNGVFALSEIAIVSSRKTRLQSRAQGGSRRAAAALRLAEKPADFLSTVQIGITLVGILTGVFGGATIAEQLSQRLDTIPWIDGHGESVAVVIVVLVITYATVILGELVPKRIGLANAEGVAMLIAPMMDRLSRISKPFVWLLTKSSDLLFRMLRIPQSRDESVTSEELSAMIRAGTAQGEFDPAEEEMVRGVFTLGDRSAAVVLRHRHELVWLDVNDAPETIQERILTSGYSRFPIGDGSLDQLIGIIDIKDLLPALFANQPFDLRAIARPPIIVHENTSALDVLRLFQEEDVENAIVVDEFGSVEGMITLNDLAATILGDGESDSLITREDGSLLVAGTTKFDVFLRRVPLPNLEPDEHTIVARFILAEMSRIPKEGDSFRRGPWRFEIVDMDGHRIDKIIVSYMKDDE